MAAVGVPWSANTTPTSRPPAPRGTLLPPSAAPPTGERSERVTVHGNVVVEQILSGANEEPQRYVQTQDEWVTLLTGAAVLDVDGERMDLRPGDWVFLAAAVPHAVVRTDAGTSWLAVHLSPPR